MLSRAASNGMSKIIRSGVRGIPEAQKKTSFFSSMAAVPNRQVKPRPSDVPPTWVNSMRGVTQEDSFKCLRSWGESVGRKDTGAVVGHYIKTAILVPTVRNGLRQGPDGIGNYFDDFLKRVDGEVKWKQCLFQAISDTHCCWSGSYTFQLKSGLTRARFSYTLVKQDDDWKILHHHSSLMPEA